ncbi:TonB-dependent receptor [Brevundimonas subvibrioides]|uniref:TonB-dependent receptor n=1 Tax=Brevundimonas subvibrioides (strain ATCC 15264 / DSM 4735 / LMG 14903 / NBRC 16000 / CB 81) TaxID=633149 RepID=D9QIT0_BRESC|nr:TonB-dependent receptor [Brevundimonas subvibrioides]ADL01413.1 TonB-dependent receptor [Brevundimonas subvibrioides ATCC 15264]
MKKFLLTGAAILCACVPFSVQAQTAGSAADPIDDQEYTGLDDIVVTAQRREENLQRAAIAVSAVDGETLTEQSITQATDLTRLVPALQIAPASSFTQIYLRGVGTFGANAFAEQGVAFNLDGIYLSRPAAPAGLFYDLERLEVLKGPQGTLYGRNATGGAVNVITAKPRLNETSGNLTTEYGNYDAFKTSGAVNLPLGDRFALRLAGQMAQHDGYFSDGYDDEDTWAVRGQLRGEFSDRLSAILSIDYADVGGMGSGGTILPLVDGDNRLGPSDPRVIAAYVGRPPTAPVPQIIARNDGYQDNTFFGISTTINADLGFAQLTVIPAYRKTDLDFRGYASSFLIDIEEQSEQSSLEARLSGTVGQLTWVAGAYVFSETVDANQRFDQGSNGTRILSDLGTDSTAVFGQATWSLTDRFRVTGGLRYTKDEKSQVTEAHTLPFVGFVPGVFPLVPIILDLRSDVAADIDFDKVTYKAGVEYDAGDASLLYATIATGFKSGVLFPAQVNGFSAPESMVAYTLGSKNRFFDNTLQLNGEAFLWDYTDQQVSHLGPVQVASTPGGPIFGPIYLTENAGAATIAGLELELVYQPTASDQFSANLQYLDATYDELKYQAYSTTGAAPAIGCPITPTTLTGASATARIYDVDCSGQPLVNAPDWSLQLGYVKTLELEDRGRLILAADTRLESSRYLSLDYLEQGRQDGYMMSNARVTWETPSGNLAITGFINNIEDELVFANSSQSPAKPGVIYNQIRPPRTYGLRLSLRM